MTATGHDRTVTHPAARRRVLRLAAAALLAVVAFVVAVTLTFPWGQLARLVARRAAVDAGLVIRFERSRLVRDGVLVTGLEVERATAVTAPDRPRLRIDRLVATPSLWGVLTGRRGMPWRARARLYGGTAEATVRGSRDAPHVDLRWTRIDLATLPLEDSGTAVRGVSSGQVAVSSETGEPTATTGTWQLQAHEVTASGLVAGRLILPAVGVTRLTSTGTWTGPRIDVTDLAATGSFGSLRLAGRIMLRHPTETSAIKAEMTFTPPTEPPPEVAVLLGLLLPPGGQDRPRSYNVTGTLAVPMVTPAQSR